METSEFSCIKAENLNLVFSRASHDGNKALREIFKKAFITNCNLDDTSITEEETQALEELDEGEIVENIKNIIDNLLGFKSIYKSTTSGELSTRCDQLEKMLQKQESEVRNHIKLEHQLKLLIESLQEKIKNLENKNLEALRSISEMENKGFETMQNKLQKIEAKFQSELAKIVKEYRGEACAEGKNAEKLKKLEEMYEKKEKALIKLQQDHAKIKYKLEEKTEDFEKLKNELKSYKKSSNSSDAFKTRRSSYNEDFNKVHHISYVFSKDSEKRMKVNEEKLIFKGSPNLCENKKIGPLEFKQNHA